MFVCSNFAAIPFPAPIDEMKPTWAELSVTALEQAACRYEVNGRKMKKPPREGGLLRRLGARSRCFCCLDPIPPLRGGA